MEPGFRGYGKSGKEPVFTGKKSPLWRARAADLNTNLHLFWLKNKMEATQSR